nr:phage portal protein [Rhodococcus sp. 06-156-3b]
MKELITSLAQRLDAGTASRQRYDKYYASQQPLTFLAPEVRTALNGRLSRVSVGIPKLLVDSIAERLRLTGLANAAAWAAMLDNDIDQLAPLVHREALTLGNAYATVWAKADGSPLISIESAHQMTTLEDPGTHETLAAFKRWETDRTTEAVLYQPDRIVRLRANATGATTQGFDVVEELDNPLGEVPVVRFKHSDRILSDGTSAMEPVLSLTDALVKLVTDLLTASEYSARPRRFATGVELAEDKDGNAVNPFPETDRMMISEDPAAKFGQLPGSDLGGYESAIGVVMRQISAVSGLPEHALGIGGDNPTSADSIRASEAALTSKAESANQTFGRAWEQVGRLAVAVKTGVAPNSVATQAQWADPSTRSLAQEADSVTKLFASGLLPASYALSRLGYDATEIEKIRVARRTEALDAAGTDLAALLP